MSASDHLGPQWHTSPHIGLGDAEWLHVGTRTAAANRAKDWHQELQRRGEPVQPSYMHQVEITAPRGLATETDEVANQIERDGPSSYKSGKVIAYTNEFEDPGSTSYLVHRSALKLQSTSKFRGK